MTNPFQNLFQDIGYRKNFLIANNQQCPEDIIIQWRDFVQDIEDGYNCVPPEFDHDLNLVRADIDFPLNSSDLQEFEDHKNFCSAIHDIDKKFLSLTNEIKFLPIEWNWWQRRVLKKAGPEYADFINIHWTEKYGIRVEKI